MPRLSKKVPSYRHHRPSGRAVVTLNGSDRYLGGWNTPESRVEYDRLIGEWLAAGRGLVAKPEGSRPDDPTVGEVILAYWKHAETHYRDPDGNSTDELKNMRYALKMARKLYSKTPARQFGPLALRAVRDALIKTGLARTTVNARINRIRRVFKWAVSVEMIPGSVTHALRDVDGLKQGRSEAPEPRGVAPVAIEHVEATIPHLPRPVAAMVRLQLLSGCRAGEVMGMQGCDLVPGDPNWEYRPGRHKNSWRGKTRIIPLGPKSQEIVREFLKPDPDAYLFSPQSAVVTHRDKRARSRKSKPTPSERARKAKEKPGERHARRYNRQVYRQAVVRACDRAFPHPEVARLKGEATDQGLTGADRHKAKDELKQWVRDHRDELATWRRAHRWSPLQLRHTAATAIRATYGLEAAQTVLGHAKADTTQIYAERDLAKAHAIMAEVG